MNQSELAHKETCLCSIFLPVEHPLSHPTSCSVVKIQADF